MYTNNTTTHKRKHVIIGTVIEVKGRTVGQVIGNEYVKDITNRHILTTPEAIANDLQALHSAERAGAEYCVFTDTDTGIIYRAAIAKIWDMGTKFNRGWGDQVYLTLPNWTQEPDPNFIPCDSDVKPLNIKSRAAVGVTFKATGKKTARQLDLFGGRE